MINLLSLFTKYPSTRITYINQKENKKWNEWKHWNECNEREKEEANLREIFPNEIILDLENKDKIEETKAQLDAEGYKFYLYNTGSRGIHFSIFFTNLDKLKLKERNYIRKKFISMFNADLSKSSENTVIAMEGKPHFKTNLAKILIYEQEGENELSQTIIINSLEELEQLEKKLELIKDIDYTDYHTKDPFFNYIKNNIIPDDTARNDTIFPNIAIGLVKEGLTKEQIKELMGPIILKNFPGKHYGEFEGWVKKAFTQDITDYNQYSINSWVGEHTPLSQPYDLTPLSIEEQLIKKNVENKPPVTHDRKRFLTDKEFEETDEEEISWVIKDWIAEGDICFIAGKAASFKSTIASHIGYCVSEGLLVFNKYEVKKSKVLYVNEENNRKLFKKLIRRVKKGMGLKELKSENVYLSTMENFRIDEIEDVKILIDYIKQHDIKLIVLDSFRRFFVGKENEADVINRIFNTLKFIRTECNDITIIALHHAKKDSQDNSTDMRDILRGSSDIVNSADSVIGIKRAMKSDKIVVEHIKNRSGEEIKGKVIQIDNSDGGAYIWEVGDVKDKETKLSKPDECAEKLLELIENKHLPIFTRKDTVELEKSYSHDTITKAIRVLKDEGILIENGAGKYVSYSVNYDSLFKKTTVDSDKEETNSTL